ncbi:hypothetical protein M0R45_037339 [Rubus argutus]|uniref:X8 domain-containing protein n=1 Tax=Rubus argutus TaxID=59490 RepID=A0AAW1W204_RUBAR
MLTTTSSAQRVLPVISLNRHNSPPLIQTGGGSSGPKLTQPTTPSSPGSLAAAPSTGGSGGKKWCVPNQGQQTGQALHNNINWLCGTKKVDCSATNGGGKCYAQAFLQRASYIMDLYYKKNGRHSYDCDFKGSAHLTTINPSWGNCIYGS